MNHWPDEEQILMRFREWLAEAHAEAEQLAASDGDADVAGPDVRAVGLYQVIEAFTALRQELKLETKSARALSEQVTEGVTVMQQAIEQFSSLLNKDAEAVRAAGKPMAEALVDLDEALERGIAVIENARHRLLNESTPQLRDKLDDLFDQEPWWRRWACRRYYDTVREQWLREVSQTQRDIFAALLEGYGLIQHRLRRCLKEERIQRIPCDGQTADSHCMTVIEVVDDPDRPAGLIVEEVRRGYWWKGKVLRFAEVRAVRG